MSGPSKKKRLEVALAGLLEIPQDIVFDLPRLTMLGNIELLVENHKGIVEYTPEHIRIKLERGEISISGQDMTLGDIQTEQILVGGTIHRIEYDG